MNHYAISQAPDVNQEARGEDQAINIKLVSSLGDEVFFKIKFTTKISKLQSAYANKVGKDVGSISFFYDGKRIDDDDNTPASLEMEDDAVVEVMVARYVVSIYLPPFSTVLPDIRLNRIGRGIVSVLRSIDSSIHLSV